MHIGVDFKINRDRECLRIFYVVVGQAGFGCISGFAGEEGFEVIIGSRYFFSALDVLVALENLFDGCSFSALGCRCDTFDGAELIEKSDVITIGKGRDIERLGIVNFAKAGFANSDDKESCFSFTNIPDCVGETNFFEITRELGFAHGWFAG